MYRIQFDGGCLTISDASGEGCTVPISQERRRAARAALDSAIAEAVRDAGVGGEHVSAKLFSGDLRVYAEGGYVNIQILDAERDLANYVRLTPADAAALSAQLADAATRARPVALAIAS